MMDEDYTHWICINRATTISNDSTKQKKMRRFTGVHFLSSCISIYMYMYISGLCIYSELHFFLPIHGGSEVYIPYKLFSKVCNVYLVVLKKNWGKKFIYQQILI